MRSKFLFLFLFAILLINFASAVTYQQNTDANFTASCDLINCSDGDIYLTIVNAQGSAVIDNQNTSKHNGYVLYEVGGGNFSTTGEYQYFLSSDNDDYSSTFSVTPNGEQPTTAKAFFYLGLIFLLVIFMVIAIFIFSNSEEIWARAGSLGAIYLFLTAIFFVAWNMAADFLTSSPFLIEFLRILFLIMIIGFFPFLLGLFAYGVYMAIQISEIKKLQEQGYSFDEAFEKVKKRKRRLMK